MNIKGVDFMRTCIYDRRCLVMVVEEVTKEKF